MSISLLGGDLKGLKLAAPKGDMIRPTSVLLKRRLFDAHQDWSGEVFIDICAGTGAMGLEALSRGAEKVILVEKNPKVFQVLKQNIDAVIARNSELQSKIECIQQDAQTFFKLIESNLSRWQKEGEITIFFDPPYEQHQLYQALVQTSLAGISQLIIESDTDKGPDKSVYQPLKEHFFKEYCQGASYLFIYNFK